MAKRVEFRSGILASWLHGGLPARISPAVYQPHISQGDLLKRLTMCDEAHSMRKPILRNNEQVKIDWVDFTSSCTDSTPRCLTLVMICLAATEKLRCTWCRHTRQDVLFCKAKSARTEHVDSNGSLFGRDLMKRATGPGKVEELFAPPGRDDLVQGALLFNFDDDDEAIKPEHRQWLEANAIPLLRPENGVKAFLNGTASKIGAADYNRALSQRREESVKRFLTGNGVSLARLTATFTGRDLSTSRQQDDEHDRAVTVWLQLSDPQRPRVIPNRPSPFQAEAPSPVGRTISPHLHLGFALGGKTLFPNVLPSLSGGDVEVRPNEVTSCTVLNAAGREMFLKNAGTPTSSSSPIFARAKVFDPTKSESSQNGRVKITEPSQVVNVRGLSPGKNDIVFTQASGPFVDIVGSVTVLLDAQVFFHFVDGVPGVRRPEHPAWRPLS